nr:MAG TPA: pentapeptide repeat protein [Caudoviricetes sp.]
MKKVRIIKNKETYFESHFYTSYENEKIIEIDFNDLHDADLHRTDLYNADLSCAILCHADLKGADLDHTNLSCANLSGANLQYANLQVAILDEKERIRKGKIINKKTFVYKKCQGKIVKLELQIGSIVFSINNKKCRTNKAKVISIDGNNKKGLQIESDYDNNFIYEVGKIVEVPNFNLMYNVECASGIHFFWTKNKAKKYFD